MSSPHGTPRRLLAASAVVLSVLAHRTASPEDAAGIRVRSAASHPMRYHVSLPSGWTRDRTWPVVIVIPDAARDFEGNLARFVAARGPRPFLLVAPEILTCGGAAGRTPDHYSYSAADWESIRAGDDFAFDDAGLGAVLADVRARYGGDAKAFLTGWEAGGHTVWAQTLRRPERWRAVAPVSTNYQRRGLDPGAFSSAPERTKLPIQPFRCGAPTGEAAAAVAFVEQQTDRAIADARAHGFAPLPVRVVPGVDHGPLPDAVLAWFETLLSPKSPTRGRRR